MRKLSVIVLSLALLAGGVVLAQTTDNKGKPKTETKAEKKEVKKEKKEAPKAAKETKKEENKPAAAHSK